MFDRFFLSSLRILWFVNWTFFRFDIPDHNSAPSCLTPGMVYKKVNTKDSTFLFLFLFFAPTISPLLTHPSEIGHVNTAFQINVINLFPGLAFRIVVRRCTSTAGRNYNAGWFWVICGGATHSLISEFCSRMMRESSTSLLPGFCWEGGRGRGKARQGRR